MSQSAVNLGAFELSHCWRERGVHSDQIALLRIFRIWAASHVHMHHKEPFDRLDQIPNAEASLADNLRTPEASAVGRLFHLEHSSLAHSPATTALERPQGRGQRPPLIDGFCRLCLEIARV